jgi:hypothetical protein
MRLSKFPDKLVIHLDVLDYSHHDLPGAHRRITKDFFDFSAADCRKIGTILFCHVLQFLDTAMTTVVYGCGTLEKWVELGVGLEPPVRRE